MSIDSRLVYKTLAKPSEGLCKEKGSKFLGFALPVNSEEEAKTQIVEYRKKYFDARHLCFAYIIGYQKDKFRAYDDGEPNHSAGDPILNQLKSFDLTDVLLIVVRYFGGTKLGVSGLIIAYKTAAYEALSQAQIVEKIPHETLIHKFDYQHMNKVMAIVKQYKLPILKQEMAQDCELRLEVPLHLVDEVKKQLLF